MGGIPMTNYLVYPDLYEGSALTEISENLESEMKNLNISGEVIKFEGELKKLDTGALDDPEIFFKHNINLNLWCNSTFSSYGHQECFYSDLSIV